MFNVGDKVLFKTPEEIVDWNKIREAAKKEYLNWAGKELTISEVVSPGIYCFLETDLIIKEEALIPIVAVPIIERNEFEELFDV